MARSKKTRSKRFVIDSSIVAAWHFADEQSPFADAVAICLAKLTAVVPSIFHLEIANILVVGERRKRSTEAQSTAFLVHLSALPIAIDTQTSSRAWADTIALARAHRLTAYDAAYLELALRESLPLASLDGDLINAANTVGLPLFAP